MKKALDGTQPLSVYCINLRRSVERRRHMEREFSRLGWEPTFVEAVDGPVTHSHEDLLRKQELSPDHHGIFNPLSLTEIGCSLSHEKVWKLIVDRREPYAIVCEDDLRFRDPQINLHALLRVLPEDCDLLYLYYLNTEPDGFTAPAFDAEKSLPVARFDSYQIFSAWSCGGAQFYLITARGASRALSFTRPIKFPVDGYLGRLGYEQRLKLYALHPLAAETGLFQSTIY